MAMADVEVDCMKRDCKWNRDAKCCAARILVGMGPECETYEPDPAAMMGALAMAGAAAGGAPVPAPMPAAGGAAMAPRPVAPQGGAPARPGAGLLGLLAGRGGAAPG